MVRRAVPLVAPGARRAARALVEARPRVRPVAVIARRARRAKTVVTARIAVTEAIVAIAVTDRRALR